MSSISASAKGGSALDQRACFCFKSRCASSPSPIDPGTELHLPGSPSSSLLEAPSPRHGPELRSVDTTKLHLALDRAPAGPAHAGAIHHEGHEADPTSILGAATFVTSLIMKVHPMA